MSALAPSPHGSLSERARHVERGAVLHDVVTSPRELVGDRLDGDHWQRVSTFLLVIALDPVVVADGEVRSLNEGPGMLLGAEN